MSYLYEFGSTQFFQANPACRPSVINTQINGVDAYATADLFTAHPTRPGYWLMHGRADDQIMHSNGEKVRIISSLYITAVLTQRFET